MTGADTTRTRTVAFTRDALTATATIEVLDGNGTVVATKPVASGASDTVTLPDTDGTYDVRVRQTSASGNDSLTPRTTITLDRVAPTAGPAPTNSGSDTTRVRTIAFTRASDTTTATIEVLDANGAVVETTTVASGNSGTVTLPDQDGAYTVRVKQTDAAGNSSTTPATTLTLDRSAPMAGPAPTVTGAGNTRTRTVAFTRDGMTQTATIEVLDANGTVVVTKVVASGGTDTIDLPDTDGTYEVRVRQTSATATESLTPRSTVTLDRVAPDAGPAPTLTGADTARTRTVTFTRDASTVTATIIVTDESGTVVLTQSVPTGDHAAITLPGEGRYHVTVKQVDGAGNDATTLATDIAVDTSGPAAGAAPAVTGDVTARTRHVHFDRAPDAAGAVIELHATDGTLPGQTTVPSGGDADITLPDVDGDYVVRVRQTDAAGNASVTTGSPVTLTRSTGGSGTGGNGGDTGGSGTGDTGGGSGGGTGGPGTGDTGGNTGGGNPTTGTTTGAGEPQDTDPGGFGTLLADCYGGRLVLTDVHTTGTTVAFAGITAFAPGTAVTIVDAANVRVATTTVDARGQFAATAPLPAVPAQKKARYTAIAGSTRSRPLKLRRAAVLTAINVAGATATLSGKLDLSAVKGKPRLTLAVRGGRGATACKAGGGMLKLVGKPKINARTGAFTVKVKLPSASGRVAARVRVTGSLKSATLYATG